MDLIAVSFSSVIRFWVNYWHVTFNLRRLHYDMLSLHLSWAEPVTLVRVGAGLRRVLRTLMGLWLEVQYWALHPLSITAQARM